jgi:membrane protease YdiL (CAAX protease family)
LFPDRKAEVSQGDAYRAVGLLCFGLLALGLMHRFGVSASATSWLAYLWLTGVAFGYPLLRKRRFPIGAVDVRFVQQWWPYLAIVGVGGVITSLPAFPFHQLMELHLLGPAQLARFALGTVLAPLSEEVLFRGVIQTGFNEGARGSRLPLRGTLCAALVFGLSHAFNYTLDVNAVGTAIEVASACAFGVLIGYGYQRTGNLLGAIAAHIVGNIATFG